MMSCVILKRLWLVFILIQEVEMESLMCYLEITILVDI